MGGRLKCDFPMPSGFPARIINPDGTYATPTHIRSRFSGNVKSWQTLETICNRHLLAQDL